MFGKLISAFLAGAVLMGTAVGQQALSPLLPQPPGLAWPSEAWPEGPAPGEDVAALIAEALQGDLGDVMGESRAVVIIHRGRLVAEAYREGFGPNTKQVSWSMAKSVTQALVGRAIIEGRLDHIEAAMPSPWPQSDPRAAVTWRQWLNMTDGLDYKEINASGLADNDVVQMMFGAGRFDVLAYVSDLPQIHAAGRHWNYSTAGLHLIGRALQSLIAPEACAAKTGPAACRAEIAAMSQWMEATLFGPLGMKTVSEFDAAGTFLGGSLVWASARDFAKFGYLYLRDGVWEGERLLPEGWVNYARTPTPADNTNVYGAGWWISPPEGEAPIPAGQGPISCPCDAFSAQGHEGQTVWIVPSKDLVIVHLGLMANSEENWSALYEWNQRVARAFPDVAPDQVSSLGVTEEPLGLEENGSERGAP